MNEPAVLKEVVDCTVSTSFARVIVALAEPVAIPVPLPFGPE
jgi:hypothetical protein